MSSVHNTTNPRDPGYVPPKTATTAASPEQLPPVTVEKEAVLQKPWSQRDFHHWHISSSRPKRSTVNEQGPVSKPQPVKASTVEEPVSKSSSKPLFNDDAYHAKRTNSAVYPVTAVKEPVSEKPVTAKPASVATEPQDILEDFGYYHWADLPENDPIVSANATAKPDTWNVKVLRENKAFDNQGTQSCFGTTAVKVGRFFLAVLVDFLYLITLPVSLPLLSLYHKSSVEHTS